MRIDSYAKILRHGDGKRPAGEADRQQRRLVQRDIQRQFARSEASEATAKSYLKGAAQVADATVRVSSGANFSGPELRVSDYDLTVSNYAKADVWCSGRLKINASTAAKVTYGGPCTVETVSDNIQRRK